MPTSESARDGPMLILTHATAKRKKPASQPLPPEAASNDGKGGSSMKRARRRSSVSTLELPIIVERDERLTGEAKREVHIRSHAFSAYCTGGILLRPTPPVRQQSGGKDKPRRRGPKFSANRGIWKEGRGKR